MHMNVSSNPADVYLRLSKPCPKCGGHRLANMSTAYLSNPPQYKWHCRGCEETGMAYDSELDKHFEFQDVTENYQHNLASRVLAAIKADPELRRQIREALAEP